MLAISEIPQTWAFQQNPEVCYLLFIDGHVLYNMKTNGHSRSRSGQQSEYCTWSTHLGRAVHDNRSIHLDEPY